ncbi:hypothetical protein INT43_003257 [Umbelopsis isabellina]|uniref:PH domain-containing protein n=1 Tax=Mortierella isabellina TaxID=91625 RepID=A0A8H7PPH0_MORIS|nr:hypothetical protein INT43_003257 [Umbelopsis isabellina]
MSVSSVRLADNDDLLSSCDHVRPTYTRFKSNSIDYRRHSGLFKLALSRDVIGSSTTLSTLDTVPEDIPSLIFDDASSTTASTSSGSCDSSPLMDAHRREALEKLSRRLTLDSALPPYNDRSDLDFRRWSMPVLQPPPYTAPPACLSRPVSPRPEEGQEQLPKYSCTVYKMGYLYVKREMDRPGVKARDRSWRKLYVRLWGTSLAIYKSKPIDIQQASKVCLFTMQQVDAGLALDYVKRRNVIRLRTLDGPQLLLRSADAIDIISWVEHLQASANVSTDLDSRKMPKFITLPRRRRRPNGQETSATTISNGSALERNPSPREVWRRSMLDTLARDDQNNQDVEQALI